MVEYLSTLVVERYDTIASDYTYRLIFAVLLAGVYGCS